MLAGLEELHRLGFVHRDLKPENIVLNPGNPLQVALIDFDRALPTACKTKSGIRGTPGYQPENYNFDDGDPQWDLYALVAIIAECDMGVNSYLKVKNEREGQTAIKRHIEDKQTCRILANLVQSVIFCPRGGELPTFEEVSAALKEINFRKKIESIGHGPKAL